MPHSEKQLISSLIKGDINALKQVYDIYWSKIYQLAFKYLGNGEDAEEAVQDIMLRLWQYRKNLRKDGNFEGYLTKIAQSSLLNKLRGKKLKVVPLIESTVNHSENFTENQVLAKELEILTQDIIEQLPPRRYEIYCMSREKGMTYEEIATELSIKRKTVENHMGLALTFLKKQLNQYQKTTLFIICACIIFFLFD